MERFWQVSTISEGFVSLELIEFKDGWRRTVRLYVESPEVANKIGRLWAESVPAEVED